MYIDSVTADEWDSLDDDNQKQINLKIQKQINKGRHNLYAPYAALYSTLGDFEGMLDVTVPTLSANLISLQKKLLELECDDRERMKKQLDVQSWIEPKQKLALDSLTSIPSSMKTSISEWIYFVRNNMRTLDGHTQLADRISFLANDIDTNDSAPIDEKSLATFIMFLSLNKIEKKPSVGLNSNGCIDALWRYSKDILVEIVFLPGHESQIVTFSPDLDASDVVNKRVATLPIQNILDVIYSRNINSLLFSKEVKVISA